jgi:hypothetical protein
MNKNKIKYKAILLERDDLILTSNDCLKPAKFLVGGQSISPIEHCCLDLIEYQTKVRPDLQEIPFETGDKFFVDDSSRVIKERRHNGYSVIDGNHLTIIKSGRLPNNWPAQSCELFALNQALKLLEKRKGTIYTDSKYAFVVVHMFGKIWTDLTRFD